MGIQHYVHYLKRRVRIRFPKDPQDQFYRHVQKLDDGFDRPVYHVTRRNIGSVKEMKDGDIIWLFSQLTSPWGHLPPALDAKFVVKKIEKLKDDSLKFHADTNSQWFRLKNAKPLIDKLYTIDQKGNQKKLHHKQEKPLGFYIQSMRKLVSGDDMELWAKKLLNDEFDFISYRIKDGTRYAFKKTKSLIDQEKTVFWDRYSLPRRLAERRELVSHEKLDEYLIQMIKNKKVANVWGIESPFYFEENCYAQKESIIAKELGKYKSVNIEEC